MNACIGIRREDKNIWERRAPLTPENVKELLDTQGIQITVQPSKIRAFSDEEYKKVGAKVSRDISNCKVIVALKEMPPSFIEAQKDGIAYLLFAHVIKGQPYNMPMLKSFLSKSATLIDYEKVVDSNNRRLLFFGNYAGLAGMHITLWGYGQRLIAEGIRNPFDSIRLTSEHRSLETAKNAIKLSGDKIKSEGLPPEITPFVCGFAGYGNVSKGAQSIYDLLPVETIDPEELSDLFNQKPDPQVCYKVVFKEEHIVEPISETNHFDLQNYYNHPEKYKGVFEQYIPYLSILINGNYWDKRYPRLVTKSYLKDIFSGPKRPNLRIIGDISCDVEGAIEATLRPSTPVHPFYTYHPDQGTITDDINSKGIPIMAIDNLPGLLPIEASNYFGKLLIDFIPSLVNQDLSLNFENLDVPDPIKKAMITHKGQLTPDYQYLQDYI